MTQKTKRIHLLTRRGAMRAAAGGGRRCRAACPPPAAPPPAAAADERADSAENVRLVGYNDLQGRQSLQSTTRVGRGERKLGVRRPSRELPGDEAPDEPHYGQAELNGTSIIDVTIRPSRRPCGTFRESHREPPPRVGRLRLQVRLGPRLSGSQLGASPGERTDLRFQIFDITDRATDPRRSSWSRRSPARRRTRAVPAAAGSSSSARTKVSGRMNRATTTRPPESPASAIPSSTSAI